MALFLLMHLIRCRQSVSGYLVPTTCDSSSDYDQRGARLPEHQLSAWEPYIARNFGGGCDIGSVERVYPQHYFRDVPKWIEDAVRWAMWQEDGREPILLKKDLSRFFSPNKQILRSEIIHSAVSPCRISGSYAISACHLYGC